MRLLPPAVLLLVCGPAFANERLGGGFGSLIMIAVGVLVMLGVLFGLASIGEFLNRITGRAGDHEFGPKLLMVGGTLSMFAGFLYVMFVGTRADALEDFLVVFVCAFLFLGWWMGKST